MIMNKRMNFFFRLTVILTAITVFSACGDDDEETKNDYYGTWESRVYPANATLTLFEKMEFTFTNTTFEDKVYQGASADAIGLACGMKGEIIYNAPSTLNAEISDISIQGGAYTNKVSDRTAFDGKFSISLGTRLNEEFVATYTFSNDTMILLIPMKTSVNPVPLKLTKKQ